MTVLILLLASWMIKYPDIMTSRITVTTQNPPVRIIAQSSGKLIKLFVEENQFVSADTYLAAIENPANFLHVVDLKQQLHSFESAIIHPDTLAHFDLKENLILGELQNDYSNFLQSYRNHQFFIESDYHVKKVESIESQVASYEKLNGKIMRQKEILAKEMGIAQKKYENNKILF